MASRLHSSSTNNKVKKHIFDKNVYLQDFNHLKRRKCIIGNKTDFIFRKISAGKKKIVELIIDSSWTNYSELISTSY